MIFRAFLLLFVLDFSYATTSITFYGNRINPVITDGSELKDDWVATAVYSKAEEHISNFGQLIVSTNGDGISDDMQTFGAGYLEGMVTAEKIYQNYQNMLCQVDCSGNVPPEVQEFFTQQDLWAREQVAKNGDCNYWKNIGSLLSQMDGLILGYAASDFAKTNVLPLWAFTMINSMGDLFDILPATAPAGSSRSMNLTHTRPDFDGMTYKEVVDYMRKSGHCSAMVKVTDDLSEMFMGHSSWFTYSAMLRIYKTYKFALHNPASKHDVISFSSYPGMLSSLDDFYMMSGPSSKLVMLQTTNSIFNATLWDLVKPQSLLAWQRVRTANQLSSSGPEWYDNVAAHNSGTYNNQYMIIDASKFTPGNSLQPNALFVVEQIPGYVAGSDVTDELINGYWGSFNVPYHRDIYEMSGYGSVDEKAGHSMYTEYQMAPRAQIFRREQGSVKDLETMQRVMRYNEWQTDPYSGGSAWGAICARGDLEPGENPYPGGGYDTKITTWSQLTATNTDDLLGASIVNGPTAQDQEPFRWSTSGLGDSNNHFGMPDLFDFKFENVHASSIE